MAPQSHHTMQSPLAHLTFCDLFNFVKQFARIGISDVRSLAGAKRDIQTTTSPIFLQFNEDIVFNYPIPPQSLPIL